MDYFQLNTFELSLLIVSGLMLFLMALLLRWLYASKMERQLDRVKSDEQKRQLQEQLQQFVQNQHEMGGRIHQISEQFSTRQVEFAKFLSERLDVVSRNVGDNLQHSAKATNEQLGQLHQRLTVIDAAQANLGELSRKMSDLRDILNNKQSRGSFGQGRMEAIIADNLPKESYRFQGTLSNNTKPDCLISLPNSPEKLVIDAKFPLEAVTRFRHAQHDDERKSAASQLRTDMGKHINDISQKYLIIGETHDVALMFVPSESVYAELYENFDDILQRANRARILIVGPSLLMLAIQIIQSVMRDAKMREQVSLIQREVTSMLDDVRRLDERMQKFQSHFRQVGQDVDNALISTKKIVRRGQRIISLEFADEEEMSDDQALDNASEPKQPELLSANADTKH